MRRLTLTPCVLAILKVSKDRRSRGTRQQERGEKRTTRASIPNKQQAGQRGYRPSMAAGQDGFPGLLKLATGRTGLERRDEVPVGEFFRAAGRSCRLMSSCPPCQISWPQAFLDGHEESKQLHSCDDSSLR